MSYLVLKLLHISCVAVSISLYVGRWTADRFGLQWRSIRLARIIPHINDTLLFLAGVAMLLQMGGIADWVRVKLILLPIYVVLASISLSPRRAPSLQVMTGSAAILIVLFMVSVAVTHDPVGIFNQLKRH